MIEGLNNHQKRLKRLFDLFFSFVGLLIFLVPIFILIILSTISTRKIGLYSQNRVGLAGLVFVMYKIRSMKTGESLNHITLSNDPRITRFGSFIRANNLDELPQLWNIFMGDMSFVGPRPDVPGYADKLIGKDRIVLSVRPGITGPATLKYRNEEKILSKEIDPLIYNDEIIWKDKIEINKHYIKKWSLRGDVNYILKTIFS
ncbi:sugar transferase [Lutimonas halocynthiae]|uniref:sugar transferase n=1 Tax=Lutimonas halocynthiae TaxID=1446477 RepID=UPI0025B2BAC0|nr:sugar transferase [Lutimonas halocynthiae]MDN3643633.1 sugar transferase [Lutimonas halocynthiae]